MSKQMETEGNQSGERAPLGERLAIFRVQYRRSDLLYMLYLCVVIPSITLLLAISLGLAVTFKLNEILYYILSATMITMYTSILYFDWARDYKPVMLPGKKDLQVHIFQEGLLRSLQKQEEVILWDQMTRVRYARSDEAGGNELASKLKIWRNDGKKFLFDSNFTNIDTLGSLVEREFAKRQPQATTTARQQ